MLGTDMSLDILRALSGALGNPVASKYLLRMHTLGSLWLLRRGWGMGLIQGTCLLYHSGFPMGSLSSFLQGTWEPEAGGRIAVGDQKL